MKLSLRSKYLIWLMFVILLAFAAVVAVLLFYSIHEVKKYGLDPGAEAEEVVAVVGTMVLCLPLLFGAAWWVTGKMLEPLNHILLTADSIEKGDFSRRIPPAPEDDQLARLAGGINRAFDRYAATVRRLENFSADASHQLRTPLAAIRSSAEVALQRDHDRLAYQETLGDILAQADRLQRSVDQLLLLARLDRSLREQFQPLDAAKCVSSWAEEYRDAAETAGVALMVNIPPEPCGLSGDAVLLREAFGNVIDNAFQVVNSGGAIRVELSQKNDTRLVVMIEDSGPGLTPEEQGRIFDRFYRGRPSHGAGSGLGLAIVREIVSLHGGIIRAEGHGALGGASVIMDFPALKQERRVDSRAV
ncbi:MAG TPA: ATP-binding protein [Kiritimatiellia bacterium]|nr:ATP-binding protein [Kiritimatiellia bacterium]HMP00167.1 ATP-binding protein [Kiritimatiellia bacterium]HMP96808.1 ATP-binding protein [Kiritimatiellia bacterium]